jgi:hypothetical protein
MCVEATFLVLQPWLQRCLDRIELPVNHTAWIGSVRAAQCQNAVTTRISRRNLRNPLPTRMALATFRRKIARLEFCCSTRLRSESSQLGSHPLQCQAATDLSDSSGVSREAV